MSSDPQLFIVEEEEDEENDAAKFKILLKHRPQHPDGLQLPGIAPQCPDSAERNHEDENSIKEDKRAETTSVSSTESEKPSLGQSELADNNDGLRTPTSSDHKIPMITECPPAPTKTRPNPSAKRKISPTVRRTLQLDLSREVELMFPPPTLQDDLATRKIKKGRTGDSD